MAQFLANYRDVTLRAGEPGDLSHFLAQETNAAPSDDVLVRRLTYTLLRRLERERRAVIGPTKKPADRLRDEVWSRSPDATFFNMNGRTYNGAEHWIRLWQYYKNHFVSGYWTPYDMGGEIGDQIAVIWCHRHTKRRWTGEDRPEDGVHSDRDYISRSTMVFRKEDGDWRCTHVHFSEVVEGDRPGGV